MILIDFLSCVPFLKKIKEMGMSPGKHSYCLPSSDDQRADEGVDFFRERIESKKNIHNSNVIFATVRSISRALFSSSADYDFSVSIPFHFCWRQDCEYKILDFLRYAHFLSTAGFVKKCIPFKVSHDVTAPVAPVGENFLGLEKIDLLKKRLDGQEIFENPDVEALLERVLFLLQQEKVRFLHSSSFFYCLF